MTIPCNLHTIWHINKANVSTFKQNTVCKWQHWHTAYHMAHMVCRLHLLLCSLKQCSVWKWQHWPYLCAIWCADYMVWSYPSVRVMAKCASNAPELLLQMKEKNKKKRSFPFWELWLKIIDFLSVIEHNINLNIDSAVVHFIMSVVNVQFVTCFLRFLFFTLILG